MADFNKEFTKLILAEGGYVDDPDDAGGETYLGISRRYNPKWNGWIIIDNIKKQFGTKGITSRLKKDTALTDSAKSFYKKNYWDVLFLDKIKNQEVAHCLFDTCVNCGKTAAIKFAQRTLGINDTGVWNRKLTELLTKL